jgi:hypothetical protein
MAHFAKLNENNIVEGVVVIGNDVPTSNGPLGENDMHIDGETYCQNLFKGGIWKQTSYNKKFRANYAGKGFVYDSQNNVFYDQQPYPSWTLNNTTWSWEAPVPYPESRQVDENTFLVDKQWNEAEQRWVAKNNDIYYYWNPSTSSWNLV